MSNINVTKISSLISPEELIRKIPNRSSGLIQRWRNTVQNILDGIDNRKIVVVGPCSIHNYESALDYANRLKNLISHVKDRIFIIMRVYFEKPRSCIGWKGFINDPSLNNTFDISRGLTLARKLLVEINMLGIPCGCEFLDTISPQYISDLVTWGAIGARTSESQLHRELASGLSMPIGFKNGPRGNIDVALTALKCARNSHVFLGVNNEGKASIVHTKGNFHTHVILRGGLEPNYYLEKIQDLKNRSEKLWDINAQVMIDCSHGNSRKQHKNQIQVLKYLEHYTTEIIGIMLESNIEEGRQDISNDMKYGVSITDSCLGWKDTETCITDFYQCINN